MRSDEYESQLSELFAKTTKAHHAAFSATQGEDEEWPIWCANYLQNPMSEVLDTRLLKSNLVYCMMNVDYEYKAKNISTQWQDYYAKHFVDHFAPTDSPIEDTLALYYSPTCPFCRMVLNTINQLNISIELRNTDENIECHNELVTERNRATVPVLRITSPDGNERWMPESRDIISYLERTYPIDNEKNV